jgi:hypothetical protein
MSTIEQDAARYRWLRSRMFAADFAYGDPPVCAIVFTWPEKAPIGANLDASIDDARKLPVKVRAHFVGKTGA